MRQVSDAEYDAMRAGLAAAMQEQARRHASEPKPAQNTATPWWPDCWPVIGCLLVALWPVYVWHTPIARCVALGIWWAFLVPFAVSRVLAKRR